MKGQDLIDKLERLMLAPDTETAQTNGHATPTTSTSSGSVDDEIIIEKCRGAANAAKFSALFDRGDVHAHHNGDDSRADLSLLGMLAFWTQDAAQLEKLFSSSALGRREKWRRRDDYRKRTIRRALSDLGETYDWSREPRGARPIKSTDKANGLADLPYKGKSVKSVSAERRAERSSLELVRFSRRPAPKAREFVIPGLLPRYHPTTLYGWGGTAKSLIALLLGMSVAGGKQKFLGRDVMVHGPVLYVDFELDADEQHRRVMQLAAGLGTTVPEDLLYISALGVRTHEAIAFALAMCEEHQAVMSILDSLGPAMVGDMAAAKDVIEFHNCYIAPFRGAGVTPILVDHQARQQAGEGYQSKGAFGSAYKEHLSRSLIQVEAGDRSAEQGTLNVRLRHKKTNFGALCDPFDVELTFSPEEISASVRELTPSDRAQEATLNARDRVLAALEDGPAYPDELAESTGLARSTIKNEVNRLKKAERVEKTGEVQGKMEEVRLTDLRTLPIREKSVKTVSNPAPVVVDLHTHPIKEKYAKPTPDGRTVADLFQDPPPWLRRQMNEYHVDPSRHLGPLATAVASALFDDPSRKGEVMGEVEALMRVLSGQDPLTPREG